MNALSTITLAEKLIPLIVGTDTERTCETITPGRYMLTDAAEDSSQAITALNIVTGVFTWSTGVLDDMTSGKAEVATASAVLASRLDSAIELGSRIDPQVSLSIWSRVKMLADRSGFLATLHSPSEREVAGTIVPG